MLLHSVISLPRLCDTADYRALPVGLPRPPLEPITSSEVFNGECDATVDTETLSYIPHLRLSSRIAE